jgi:hypothetical protein
MKGVGGIKFYDNNHHNLVFLKITVERNSNDSLKEFSQMALFVSQEKIFKN